MTVKYEEIEKALNILGLPEKATLKQIKDSYRKLIVKWHPDKCRKDPKECKEMSQKVIEAYKIIIEYCNNYEYSFKKEDIKKQRDYEEFWAEQFGNDPIWGCSKQ